MPRIVEDKSVYVEEAELEFDQDVADVRAMGLESLSASPGRYRPAGFGPDSDEFELNFD